MEKFKYGNFKYKFKGNEEFIEGLKNRYNNLDNITFEKLDYRKTKLPVILTCKKHGDFKFYPTEFNRPHYRKYNPCGICNDELRRNHNKWSLSKEDFIKKVIEKKGDQYSFENMVYHGLYNKVILTCKDHGDFLALPYNALKFDTVCPNCTIKQLNQRKTTEYFINKSKSIHGDKYNYDKVIYTTSSGYVIITCPKHGDFKQRASSHTNGNGCYDCHRESLLNNNFVEDARKIHGDKYDYSKVKYLGNKRKVEIICPKHGSFWVKPNAHVTKKCGCPRCIQSYGELLISNLLKDNGIKFIPEYKINGYRYRFDFYLPELKIFIEFHGKQHYVPVDRFGGEKAFEKTKIRDALKVKLVKDLGEKLIVLNYRDLELKILDKKLKNELLKATKYYFIENDKVLPFKRILQVYKYFKLNLDIPCRDLESILEKDLNVKKFNLGFKTFKK